MARPDLFFKLMGLAPTYPGPSRRPPWAAAWDLLHPRAFERGYPDRPLASFPGDYDPQLPAPNRLVARLRARHAVREAAGSIRGVVDIGDVGVSIYHQPTPDEDAVHTAVDRAIEAIQASPAWRSLVQREVFRRL